jgi:hypothetical protein
MGTVRRRLVSASQMMTWSCPITRKPRLPVVVAATYCCCESFAEIDNVGPGRHGSEFSTHAIKISEKTIAWEARKASCHGILESR